jgi:PAS domain S-box-containing protein
MGRMGSPGNEFQSCGPQALSDAAWVKTLLNAVSDHAIYMLGPEGRIASWNQGATELTGYRESEVLGLNFSHLFLAEDKSLPQKLLEEARKGRAEREVRQRRKDGSHFWASIVLHPAHGRNGELIGFAQVTRDIADRVAAEHALSDSERRFRLLVEGVTDYAIYMLDPSGVVTNWNTGAERLKGYSADEIVGHHFSRFYTKEDRQAGLPAQVLAIAMREGSYQGEGWRVRKDGGRFWASVVVDAIRDAHGRLIGFAKISRDVSERRAAQEALRSSERQFRLLVNGIRDYAIYMLDPGGVISSWNAGAERIKGYSANEIIGHHFSRFYTEADRAAGTPVRALVTAASEGRFEAEGWRVRKDGSAFWASVVVDRIQDENGKLLGFAKITRDITERRNAQLALQEVQAQRVQAQKMEALGHLTGGVAHDFNNLLMIIGGQNQILKRLTRDVPRSQRAVDGIEMAIARGAALTRQLLSFSRRQTLKPSAIDVGSQIGNFKAMLAGTMGGMTVTTDVPAETWPLHADSNELELALLNLAINARDAMPNGGVIAISASNATLTGTELPAGLAGDFVALSVADTGTGIAPDVLPKIFDPFFTTKQVDKGTGLGLSQVHGFVHQSGGTLAIDTKLGEGTRITLYLPRASAEAAEEQEKSEVGEKATGTILLVEDNPDVADASRAMLEELGYRCEITSGAEAAMDAIRRQDFDLLLTDVIMPGSMDGTQLARNVRALKPGMPVLLVSGFPKNADETGFPLLRKPYNLVELGRAIRTTLAGQDGRGNVVRLKPR